jgi:hypothetical protein
MTDTVGCDAPLRLADATARGDTGFEAVPPVALGALDHQVNANLLLRDIIDIFRDWKVDLLPTSVLIRSLSAVGTAKGYLRRDFEQALIRFAQASATGERLS